MNNHQTNQFSTSKQELTIQTRNASDRIFFGGSFDPVHLGHTQLPNRIASSLDIQHVIYVPAARSPFKSHHPTADHHRLAMLQLALHDHPNCEVWQHELVRGKSEPDSPSYWADTWSEVQRQCDTGTNMFLIGTDQARSMHKWYRYEAFWKDAIVMLRLETGPNTRTDFLTQSKVLIEELAKQGVWSPDDLNHWETRIVQAPLIDASSTKIRDTLANPQARKNSIQGLDPRVHRYILSQNLYQ